MTPLDTRDIVDTDKFCGKCGGRGRIPESLGGGSYLYDDCWYCRGTGLRTVIVGTQSNASQSRN